MTTTTQTWQGQSRREAIIVEILELYPDLIESSTGGPGDGTGTIQTPPTYTTTVQLIERALSELHSFAPVQWWHVHERYIRAERSRKNIWRHKGRWAGLTHNQAVTAQPGGWTLALTDERRKTTSKPEQVNVLVTTWKPQVRNEKVRKGISWIASRFDDYGCEPYLPQQVYEDAA